MMHPKSKELLLSHGPIPWKWIFPKVGMQFWSTRAEGLFNIDLPGALQVLHSAGVGCGSLPWMATWNTCSARARQKVWCGDHCRSEVWQFVVWTAFEACKDDKFKSILAWNFE